MVNGRTLIVAILTFALLSISQRSLGQVCNCTCKILHERKSVCDELGKLHDKVLVNDKQIMDEWMPVIEFVKDLQVNFEKKVDNVVADSKNWRKSIPGLHLDFAGAIRRNLSHLTKSISKVEKNANFINDLRKELSEEKKARNKLEEGLMEERNNRVKLEELLKEDQRSRQELEKGLVEEQNSRVKLEELLKEDQRSRQELEKGLMEERNSRVKLEELLKEDQRSRQELEKGLVEERNSRVKLEEMVKEEQRSRKVLEKELENIKRRVLEVIISEEKKLERPPTDGLVNEHNEKMKLQRELIATRLKVENLKAILSSQKDDGKSVEKLEGEYKTEILQKMIEEGQTKIRNLEQQLHRKK